LAGCAAVYEADRAFEERSFETALAGYRAVLVDEGQPESDRLWALSRIARCLLELEKYSLIEPVLLKGAEALKERQGEEFRSDPLAGDFFFAAYMTSVAKRALFGIEDAATKKFAEFKREFAEAAVRRAVARLERWPGHPYARLLCAEALRAAQRRQEALEKLKNPPVALRAEFDKLRAEIEKELR
jgi:hypothetical protein